FAPPRRPADVRRCGARRVRRRHLQPVQRLAARRGVRVAGGAGGRRHRAAPETGGDAVAVRVRRRITGPVAVVVIAVCAVFAARDHGADGVLSAGVGGVVVVLFLGSTRAVLGPMVTALPHASMATSLLFYLTKVAA